jgi:hypothetical protein
MSKLVFYSCLVFIAVAGIMGIALLSGDKTLAQNSQGQGPSRVIVTNTPLPVQAPNPLPVTVTNQPAPAAVSPFQGSCQIDFATGNACNISIIPNGKQKQLVMQAVSALVSIQPTTFIPRGGMQITPMGGTQPPTHFFPLFSQGADASSAFFSGMQPITWIFDPAATAVQCLWSAPMGTSGGSSMICTVTGYLQ